jgi:hypothetical protein
MPHLRQVLLVLVVVAAMYLFANWTGRLLTYVLAFGHYDLFIWIDRLAFLLWGVLAGVVLMRLLTWPLRLLAALALPVLVLLVVPNIAYMRARSLIQSDVPYAAMWPYFAYLALPVLGMAIGALLSRPRQRTQPGL